MVAFAAFGSIVPTFEGLYVLWPATSHQTIPVFAVGVSFRIGTKAELFSTLPRKTMAASNRIKRQNRTIRAICEAATASSRSNLSL